MSTFLQSIEVIHVILFFCSKSIRSDPGDLGIIPRWPTGYVACLVSK